MMYALKKKPNQKKKTKPKTNKNHSSFDTLQNKEDSKHDKKTVNSKLFSDFTLNLNETFKETKFVISDQKSIIRDNEWKAIKYKKGDNDLPLKKGKDGKDFFDESYIGKEKIIPKGKTVTIDDVYIKKNKSNLINDKLLYVHIKGFGWTSVDNISGGLKGHSVGVLVADRPLSETDNHYTVAVENSPVLIEGNRYPKYGDNRVIAMNKEVELIEKFSGYYGSDKKRSLAKIKYDDEIAFTSYGNLSKTPLSKEKSKMRTVVDNKAYLRKETSSYIPKDSEKLSLGDFVVVCNEVKKNTGSYVEIYTSNKLEEEFVKGNKIGWTNKLNLFPGLHSDLKSKNSKWDQVIPDERYDRAIGKDTEGTAKFIGNDDMIQIVDSKGEIEYISKLIWPSLKNMLGSAKSDGHNLQLNTGFRSWDSQQALVDDPRYAANPAGYSNHQIGIAVDLNNKLDTEKNGINWWMERNAYKFGFVRTYKKYKEGHHWEYRPNEVTKPVEVEKEGKKYIKYVFATFESGSDSIWDRNSVYDEKVE